jgi:C-terminal processing protease CtpA/Prc
MCFPPFSFDLAPVQAMPNSADGIPYCEQVNDVILSVDGTSLVQLDLEDIKRLTVGDEGSVVEIKLQRDGAETTTTLQRIQGEMAISSGYGQNYPLHATAPR